jgi:isopentenyl diphosphate isomerase/L-lactate dehydrogenase-like FMN-dependent dehydrogenase
VKSKCTTGKERMGGLGIWPGQEFQAALNWHTVKLIKEKYNIPLVLKGIATAEDTRIAVVSDRLVVVPHEQGQQADPLAHKGLQLRPERARVSSRRAAGFGPAPL